MADQIFQFVPQLLVSLRLIEQELLLFAAFWFIFGAIDELVVDLVWLGLRVTGRARDRVVPREKEVVPLVGRMAVLVPAWHEADVIGAMIGYTTKAWPHEKLTIYLGCYCNDPDTIAAAMEGAGGDGRVRMVVHDREGPTTKADCLNRLYLAMCEDEARTGEPFSGVLLHDSEDMVHPAALSLMNRALQSADFVQIPVRPEPQRASPWVAGHYSDEFTEAHAKSLVVRDALGAAIPAAGVGCAFSREILERMADRPRSEGENGPFSTDSLTEDYELGLLVSHDGAKSRFLRLRDSAGELVATRAFFPATLEESVRQKTRWIHGIALQGWDRLGWAGRPVDVWMALRDRRGPLTAIVLVAAYGLLVIEGILALARLVGWQDTVVMSPLLKTMLVISFASFVWRSIWRFGFTAREYGLAEGLRACLRIPIANLVSILAGRRALAAYVRTLLGKQVYWDKTRHQGHPATSVDGVMAG